VAVGGVLRDLVTSSGVACHEVVLFRALSQARLDRMPKKVKEVVAILEQIGWALARQSGSHRTFEHPDHPMLVTISGRWNSAMTVGMLASVQRTSGIEELR
jgi:predicted RNA binding protein YcfA (HicA-like mRNA interferase family)